MIYILNQYKLNGKFYNIKKEEINKVMAFVFQASRNLSPVQLQSAYTQNNVQQELKSSSKQVKKSPIKGLAHRLHKQTYNIFQQKQNDNLYTLINKQRVAKQSQKENMDQLHKRNKISKSSHHVFKSKSKRIPFNQKQQSNNNNNYENKQNQTKRKELVANKEKNKTINLLLAKKDQDNISYIPSIPSKVQKFGYVVKDDKISYPKNIIKRNRYEGDANNSPGPGQYNIQITKKPKCILKFHKTKQIPKKTQQNHYYDDDPLINDQQALKLHNQKIKQWINRGKSNKKELFKKQKYKIIKKLKQDDQQTDQEECQYDYDVPGPGYYSYDQFAKKNYRSTKKQFQTIFFNCCQRFEQIKNKQNIFDDYYKNDYQTVQSSIKPNKNKFFISKLPKQFSLINESIAPPPGSYYPRNSIETNAIKNLINSSNKVLDNNIPRLPDCVRNDTPGPGSYDVSLPNFKIQSCLVQNQGTFITSHNSCTIKKSEKLKTEERELIKKSPKKHKILHQKVDEQIQQNNYAPFMSTSPKGLNIAKNNDYSEKKPTLRSQQKKITKNKYPFNCSQLQRPSDLIKKQQFLASIGMYQLSNTYQWNKKSYNLYFH